MGTSGKIRETKAEGKKVRTHDDKGPIAVEAPQGEDATSQLHRVLLLVGQLNYTWTNTESLLIYLIGGLARTDKETAIIIFLTLNTPRARIDLVERLAKMQKTPAECRKDILDVTARLTRELRLRNKYNHCIYSFDPESGRGATQLMRIAETKDRVRYGKVEELDTVEIQRITDSVAQLANLNKAIWAIMRKYGFQN